MLLAVTGEGNSKAIVPADAFSGDTAISSIIAKARRLLEDAKDIMPFI